jgi:hypothetical protein
MANTPHLFPSAKCLMPIAPLPARFGRTPVAGGAARLREQATGSPDLTFPARRRADEGDERN